MKSIFLFVFLIDFLLLPYPILNLSLKVNIQVDEEHFMTSFKTNLHSQFNLLMHYSKAKESQGSAMQAVDADILRLLSDPHVSDSLINNKPLSKIAQAKLKDFLMSNKDFNDQILYHFSSKNCFKNLNQTQKKKIIILIFKNMDLNDLFLNINSQHEPNNEEILDIVSEVRKEEILGQTVAKCIESMPKD